MDPTEADSTNKKQQKPTWLRFKFEPQYFELMNDL